jgi:hypothetical protein
MSSRFFYSSLDRVKVINGIQPPLTTENKNNNNNNDEIENPHLLNILNWSPLEDLVTDKTVAPPPLPTTTTTTNDENEPKSKNGYNAVQISIELQKKMLK